MKNRELEQKAGEEEEFPAYRMGYMGACTLAIRSTAAVLKYPNNKSIVSNACHLSACHVCLVMYGF